MNIIMYSIGSDLGVHIDGARLGATQLIQDISSLYKGEVISINQDSNLIKSRNLSDRKKNEFELDTLNTEIFNKYIENTKEDTFPITIGGDSSLSIATTLANNKIKSNIGVIYISAYSNYNTTNTTNTGNINGLTMATINGYKNHEFRYYSEKDVVMTAKTVLFGPRIIYDNEKDNVKYSAVNIFDNNILKEKGILESFKEAFQIASHKTNGVHIIFDLSIIDSEVSQGVSTPAANGISIEDAMSINKYISENINNVIGYDLVEFNPLRDIDRKTEQIAVNLLAGIITAVNKK